MTPSSGAAPRGRLLRKYVVVFVGLVGGVLMASSLVELYFAYQQTKAVIVREERATAVATAAKIEEFTRDIERRVREITQAASDDPAAAQLGLGKLAFRGELGAALTEQRELDFLRLLRDAPAISELTHLDVSGKEQIRVARLALDAAGSQEDFSQTPKFRETRSGKTYWSPVYFRSGAQPYLTLAVPVGQYAVGSPRPNQPQSPLGHRSGPGSTRAATPASSTPEAGCSRPLTSAWFDPGTLSRVRRSATRGRRGRPPRTWQPWPRVYGEPRSSPLTPAFRPSGGSWWSNGPSPELALPCSGRSSGTPYILRSRPPHLHPGERAPRPAHGRPNPDAAGRRRRASEPETLAIACTSPAAARAIGNELKTGLRANWGSPPPPWKPGAGANTRARPGSTDLTESLEQQTATAEVLGHLGSPTDLPPVLDMIAPQRGAAVRRASSARLRFDGEQLHSSGTG